MTITVEQTNRRRYPGMAAYAPSISTLADVCAAHSLPVRWIVLDDHAPHGQILGALRPPLVIDFTGSDVVRSVRLLRDIAYRPILPTYAMIPLTQYATLRLVLCCPPIRFVTDTPAHFGQWASISPIILDHPPTQTIWFGVQAPSMPVHDPAFLLFLDGALHNQRIMETAVHYGLPIRTWERRFMQIRHAFGLGSVVGERTEDWAKRLLDAMQDPTSGAHRDHWY
jgi:hypothetical protein